MCTSISFTNPRRARHEAALRPHGSGKSSMGPVGRLATASAMPSSRSAGVQGYLGGRIWQVGVVTAYSPPPPISLDGSP